MTAPFWSVIETIEGGEHVGEARRDVLRALGFANLDRAELFLEQIFGRGLLGYAMHHLDGLLLGRGSRSAGGGSSTISGLARLVGSSLRSLGLLFSGGGGSGRRAFGGGLGGLLFLRSGLFFGHGGKGLYFFRLGDADGLAGAFARARIGAGTLAANRKAPTVADATVAVDCLQPLQIARDLTAKVTLQHPFVLGDQVEDLVQLLFGQILSTHVRIEARFLHEQVGPGGPDAVDVTEGVRDFLLRGNFDAEETRHGVVRLRVLV